MARTRCTFATTRRAFHAAPIDIGTTSSRLPSVGIVSTLAGCDKSLQVTAAALASECKLLSHPASVDTIPTDGNREDVVPMSMGAAWKARRVVANVQRVLAIELMCAAQGLDYRAPLKPGR